MTHHALGKLQHAVRGLRARRHPRNFFTSAERHQLVAAIQAAERNTSGEIRVHVERCCSGDTCSRAWDVFAALQMDRTAHRNATLFYLAVQDRKFAVVGDVGIHALVPPSFWETIRDAMVEDFRQGRFVAGLSHGISTVGQSLKEYFPHRPDDRNELPDAISTGGDGAEA
jgi:uncharacterized membrane protein